MTYNCASNDTARRAPIWMGALTLSAATFGVLGILWIPYREVYLPTSFDIPALADGLLLAPGARWEDWFTRGYSHFWDLYPEWPVHGTEFARPAFQVLIYIAHFAFGNDWASYQIINCLAVAGMGAIAFHIARTVMVLRPGPSLLAAMLVVLSSPVVQSWLFGLAFAIEPLGTVLVGGAFLAVVARRDFLCLALLFLALLTKENTVWAPLAAAITIMLRPNIDDSLGRRALTSVIMFSPLAMWLGLRFCFFGGIGGTYATADYTPLVVLKLAFYKLTHMHHIFITYDWRSGLLERGSALFVYALLCLWAFRIVSETVNHLRHFTQENRWPSYDGAVLVTLWAAIALAFHFALPLPEERYATSVVLFAWPALVAEAERRRNAVVWLGLGACFVASLARSSYQYGEWPSNPVRHDDRLIADTLHQVPSATREIYLLAAGNVLNANPKYLSLVLGISAEIVRIADIAWNCSNTKDIVVFDHRTVDGVVTMRVTLPACASFRFGQGHSYDIAPVNGHLFRSDTMSYELPEAHPIRNTRWWEPPFHFGRTMTLQARPSGPARFIIQHGGPGGIAWFDTP